MFLLREVLPTDLDGLHRVAEHLNTVNLPDDRVVLERLIDRSRRSFTGQLDPFRSEYLFVLVDQQTGAVLGTSMIHAQHGTRRSPHIFFDVTQDERYSETLDRHFVHRMLRIGYNYNGPTEIGGLVLHPDYRGHKLSLGKWLSYVRFLYIALHRAHFRDQVLSELLPPLEDDGSSVVWESIGRHFTGMSYQEADRISQDNKEFIRSLFPAEPIYLSLLPKKVQEVIGQVGPETRGVEKMLRRIGFDFAARIDPFDGGPHFVAPTDEITIVANSKSYKLSAETLVTSDKHAYGLICTERSQAPHFVATGSYFSAHAGEVSLPQQTVSDLALQPGESVAILSF